MAKTSPLTNTEVKQAKPREKVYKLSDGKGLQLRDKNLGRKRPSFKTSLADLNVFLSDLVQ